MGNRLQELPAAPTKSTNPLVPHESRTRWPALEGPAGLVERGVHLLDNAVRVPGTRRRIGLDPLVGLVAPGVGDVLAGTVAMGILFLAVQHRVPAPVIGRMVFNIAIDSAVGALPIAGDLFDFVWKANDRNYTLLKRHRAQQPVRASLAYWAGVSLLVALGLACLVAPIVLIVWLLSTWLG